MKSAYLLLLIGTTLELIGGLVIGVYLCIALGSLLILYFNRKDGIRVPKLVLYLLLGFQVVVLLRFLAYHITEDAVYFMLLNLMVGLVLASALIGKKLLVLLPFIVITLSVAAIVGWISDRGRVFALDLNPNVVASFLCVAIFLLTDKWKLLIPVAVVAILFTGSYWGALGLLAGLAYLIATGQFSKQLAYLLLISIAVAILGFTFFDLGSTWNTADVRTVVSDGSVTSVGELDTRLNQYEGAVENISVLGNGIILKYINEDGTKLSVRYDDPVHNIFLKTLDDYGPAALAILVTLLGYLFYKAKTYRVVLVALVFSSLGDYCWIWYTSLMVWFFVIVGLASREAYELVTISIPGLQLCKKESAND